MIKLSKISAVLVAALTASSLSAQTLDLPTRQTPIPQTTNSVPHVQLGVQPVPSLSDELLRRVAEFPGVTLGPTQISLPGATGFQLSESISLTNPDALVGGLEFAHLHPDGSLHASLSPEVGRQAVEAGWATLHPWAGRRSAWAGFVMIYTPQNEAELEVVVELVASAYTHVTGLSLTE